MDIAEWLGFFISIAAVLFLLIRFGREDAKRRRNPTEYERVQQSKQEQLKKILKSLHIETGQEEKQEDDEEDEDDEEQDDEELEEVGEKNIFVSPQPKENFHHKYQAQIIVAPTPPPSRRIDLLQTTKRKHVVETASVKGNARVKSILKHSSLKNAILLREILGPPKSL